MPDVIVKINGEKLEYFENLTLSTQIDAVASSLSISTFYDIPTYEFAKIEVLRNGILIFTGTVISKVSPGEPTPKPFNYKCYSLTGILQDCALPLEAHPVQVQNKSLKEIVENICSYFNIIVKIDSTAVSESNNTYTLQDQSPAEKAIMIINKLCSQRNLILTHNSRGELIITKKISLSQAVYPNIISSNKSYNYRNFFNAYNVIGQQSIGNDTIRQAESKFSNIPTERTTTKIQRDGDSSITKDQATALKYDSYKSNTFNIEFHDYFVNTGELFIINNVKSICNAMNYNYKAGQETCSISLLNSKVYERN